MSFKKQEVTKLLRADSERVKTAELHPKEPLVICSLYSGQVTLWNYETQTLLKSFEICELPVRCVKFITRAQLFICGSDDMQIRAFNYNTMEKVAQFEAHMDYIRAIAVHDTLPIFLTASDDMTVKMFDFSDMNNWVCKMTFEGHSHYVMAATFNPKDPSTFATASLDETINVWNINTPVRNFSLEGHDGGVNCIEYYPGGDKPYLISGSDDNTVRVWDYQTKACIQTLNVHSHYVTCVAFHPDLPLVFTGSEDENICCFSTQTWKLESTTPYGMGRAWCISVKPKCNKVALGFDKGLLVLKVGKEDPTMSMDKNGKILFAQTNEILKLDIKNNAEKNVADGELIQLPAKEAGTCEGMPRKILHGVGGQYVAVLMDDEEYIINSVLGWRSKNFGRAIAFAWGNDSGTYAILENNYTLKTYKQFKQKEALKLEGSADMLFAGPVLGVRVDGNVCFFDWETLRVVRQINETAEEVVWSDSGELCALVTATATFVLKYNPDAVAEALASGQAAEEDGYECAFDLVEEIEVKMRRALWVGDCLLYVNRSDRVCYYIGGETTSLAVIQRGFSLLGYVANENRLYCMDKERNVVSYQLFTSVIEFKTAIVRGDLTEANRVLPSIPDSMRQKVAEFLQARQHLRMAMEVTTDDDHRFDLAIELGDMEVALDIVRKRPSAGKWKLVGDLALEHAYFSVAEEALRRAQDFNGLLLLFTSLGAVNKIADLGRLARTAGRSNVAFTCFQILNDHDSCIDLFCDTGRFAEAAFCARTYRQSRIVEVVEKWRRQMSRVPRIRDALADPVAYANLFPTVDLNAVDEQEEDEEEQEVHQHQAPPAPVAPVPEPRAASVPAKQPSPDRAVASHSVETPERGGSFDRLNDDVPATPANSFAGASPAAPPPTEVKPEKVPEASPQPVRIDSPPKASHVDPVPEEPVEKDDIFGDDDDDWGEANLTSADKPAGDAGEEVDDIFDKED